MRGCAALCLASGLAWVGGSPLWVAVLEGPLCPGGAAGVMLAVAAALLVTAVEAPAPAQLGTVPSIPTLEWFGGDLPSDWLNVKHGCSSPPHPLVAAQGAAAATRRTPRAVGDGLADDTQAIQACLTAVSNETNQHVVFLPAGTYKITQTLRLVRGLGVAIIGAGEPTRLVWAGAQGGHLLLSDGLSRSIFVGLVLDGQDTAAVGFEHDAHRPGLFETRIRHSNSKFINFLQAGIRIGANRTNGKLETSEVLYQNLVFANCGSQESVAFNCTKFGSCGGIAILNFNVSALSRFCASARCEANACSCSGLRQHVRWMPLRE